MQPSCPWHYLEQQPYTFCETQQCGWIQQPANTYSNLAYLIVAVMIWRSHKLFAAAVFVLFIFSTFFHTSGSVIGKLTDVAAMFVISMGLLTMALQRFYRLNSLQTHLIYWIGLTISLVYLGVTGQGNFFFMTQVLAAVTFEVLLVRQKRDKLVPRRLFQSLVAFVIAGTMWLLDVKKILCWPDVHFFSGHAVWHLFCALALWFIYRAYSERTV
jgi:hypothetical protein